MAGSFYRRNLPHWHPDGQTLFITWRLHGSLPPSLTAEKSYTESSPGQKFRILDAALDTTPTGPFWLREERIASLVAESLRRGESVLKQYALHAYVIMPNHVHILIEPHTELRRITQGIKGSTGRRSNQLLSRAGQPFWQDESFDRWVRSAGEFAKLHRYIIQNPVSAGLVTNVLDWPWSSASHPCGTTKFPRDALCGTAS